MWPNFSGASPPPPGKPGYVLTYPRDRTFIEQQGLKVIYHGDSTAVVIAIRPEMASTPNSAACSQVAVSYAAEGFSDRSGRLVYVSRGVYDDTDPAIVYVGQWVTEHQFPNAERGTETFSRTAGSSFRFAFRGSRVIWHYARAPNRGAAEVFIDGESKGVVELYSQGIQWRSYTSFGDLPDGSHVLEVRVVAREQTRSIGFVDVDFLAVE
jgi:hypothetical protein